ncbi:MAG: GNAT family N-acetyltransferase [Alistipes sp.]|nr:GNAT family N-acetyltransferase [Alistipes sp.]MDE6862335.1 GNAT family N-acetyltransferase [Alistipes sp.]
MMIDAVKCTLRAVEQSDVEIMYRWENDPEVWRVSGTTSPFSRDQLQRFVDQQRFDIYATRQLRLIIDDMRGRSVGAVDLFDFDPQMRRLGIGILVYDESDRRHGYASAAVAAVQRYARQTLGIHQIWCSMEASNRASMALFRSAGFEECGCRRDWIWTPDGYRDEIIMQWIAE